MEDFDRKYQKARRRVEEIKSFYFHLLIFVLVNTGLVILNYFTSRGNWWFYWPLLGWGVGIVAHAFSVFGLGKFLGPEWEERKINQIMEEMNKSTESTESKDEEDLSS